MRDDPDIIAQAKAKIAELIKRVGSQSREELDRRCAGAAAFTYRAPCHEGGAFGAIYIREHGLLMLVCSVCGSHAEFVRVASERAVILEEN